MKKEKIKLEELLYRTFEEFSGNQQVTSEVIEKFKSKNILEGDVIKIINKNDILESKSHVILYLLTKFFYEATQEYNLKPESWFTDLEIKEYDKYKESKSNQKKFPLIFDDVLRMADDHFTTVVRIQTISELFNSRMVTYNYETQRDPKFRVIQDKVVKRVNINTEAVADIENEIKNGTFKPNQITINVLLTGDEVVKYDAINKKLIIEHGELNILDGFHRSLAFMSVIRDIPNIERYTGLNITIYDADKARQLIRQENKQNKVNDEYLESLNNECMSAIVIKKLNERSESELKGKVATDEIFITKGSGLVLYSDLKDAIEQNYNLKNKKEAGDIGDWLIEGFNELIGLRYTEFQSKNTFISKSKVFMGYVALLAHIQNHANWKEELKKVMINITEQGIVDCGIRKQGSKNRITKELKNYLISLI